MSRTGLPEQESLRSIRDQESLPNYVKGIWERRDFLLVIPRQDARARQMTTMLGQLWHLLNPAMMIGVYYLIFGVMLDGDRGVEHYVSFLTIGILMFQLVSRMIVGSASTIQQHLGLIRTMQFPRALLPLASTIEHLITFVPAMILLFVVTMLDGSGMRWQMLLFPLIVVLMVFAFSGGALISARLGSFIPDLREILPHFFRLLMYASGVMFSIDRMVGNERLRSILKANPVYSYISLGRWSMLGMPLSTGVIISVAAWAVLLPFAGFLFFRAGEHTYGS